MFPAVSCFDYPLKNCLVSIYIQVMGFLANKSLGCAPVLSVVNSAQLSPLITAVLEDYTNHKHIHTKAPLKVICIQGIL